MATQAPARQGLCLKRDKFHKTKECATAATTPRVAASAALADAQTADIAAQMQAVSSQQCSKPRASSLQTVRVAVPNAGGVRQFTQQRLSQRQQHDNAVARGVLIEAAEAAATSVPKPKTTASRPFQQREKQPFQPPLSKPSAPLPTGHFSANSSNVSRTSVPVSGMPGKDAWLADTNEEHEALMLEEHSPLRPLPSQPLQLSHPSQLSQLLPQLPQLQAPPALPASQAKQQLLRPPQAQQPQQEARTDVELPVASHRMPLLSGSKRRRLASQMKANATSPRPQEQAAAAQEVTAGDLRSLLSRKKRPKKNPVRAAPGGGRSGGDGGVLEPVEDAGSRYLAEVEAALLGRGGQHGEGATRSGNSVRTVRIATTTRRFLAQPSNAQPYKRSLCKYYQNGGCEHGEDCTWAHGNIELRRYRKEAAANFRPHPQLSEEPYKVRLCARFSKRGWCKYGDDCGFVHGEADLRGQNQEASRWARAKNKKNRRIRATVRKDSVVARRNAKRQQRL